MSTRTTLCAAAAALGLLAGASAFAGSADACYTIASGVMRCDARGERTRDDVQAELSAARAAGRLNKVGELAELDTGLPAPVTLTRGDVRSQVLVARAAHQLRVPGELE